MDCTDIRVLLSGLVDDEVDAETRYRAERHLADCAECRALVDEAESLNNLVVESAVGDAGVGSLSPEFVGNVLGRTVLARPARRSSTEWTSWLGWFAAAAALFMAVVLWFQDQGGTRPEPSNVVVAPAPANAQPSLHRIAHSTVLADPAAVDLNENDEAWAMTREDSETLDSVALVLDMLLVDDEQTFARVEEVREIVVYDELLERLAVTQEAFGAAERLDIDAAEAALFRVVNGPLSTDDLQELRGSVESLELPAKMISMSTRWEEASSL